MPNSKTHLLSTITIAIHVIFIVEGNYISIFDPNRCAHAQSTLSEEVSPRPDDKGMPSNNDKYDEEDLLVMMADIGFGGGRASCKLNQWTPLVVTVDNRLKDIDGVIILTRPRCDKEPYETNYYFPVKIPKESNKKFMFYVPAEENRIFKERYFEEIPWSWKVTLVYKGESDLPMAIGDLDKPVHEDKQLILVVSDIGSGYEFIGKHSRLSIHLNYKAIRGVTYSKVELLPLHWIGYSGVDTVILDNLSESVVSETQQTALRDYVLLGGNLVICAGETWPQLKQMLITDVLPLPVEFVDSQPLEALPIGETLTQNYGGEIGGDRRFVICKSKMKDGRTILAYKGIPLIVEKDFGMGRIIFVAFSFSDPSLFGWKGRSRLADDILRIRNGVLLNDELYYTVDSGLSGEISRRWRRRGVFSIRTSSSLQDKISKALISEKTTQIKFFPPRFVAYFLGLYIILLVPINYIIFRKIGVEFAWLAVPILAIVFAATAYIIGYRSRAQNIAVNQISVVQAAADCPIGISYDFFGIYAPGETKTDVIFQSNPVFVSHLKSPGATRGMETQVLDIELGGWTAYGEHQPRINHLRIPPAAIRTFKTVSTAALGRGLKGNLQLINNCLAGKITNGSSFDLKGCIVIVAGEKWAPIGEIKSGTTIDIREKCLVLGVSNKLYSPSAGDELGFEEPVLRRVMISVDKIYGEENFCYLVGWSGNPVLKMRLSRKEFIKPNAKSVFIVKMPIAR